MHINEIGKYIYLNAYINSVKRKLKLKIPSFVIKYAIKYSENKATYIIDNNLYFDLEIKTR